MYQRKYPPSKQKNFILLLANSGISTFGFSLFNLIIIWSVLYITKSPFLSGLADGTLSFPLFISFFVGAIVDRIIRKKMLAIVAGVGRAFSIISILYGLIARNELTILISIYVSAFLVGLTSDLLKSIGSSWTKEFLSEDQYKNGASSQNSINLLGEGAGYVLSGFILVLGFSGAFAAIIVVFAVSIIPLFFISPEESKTKMNKSINGAFVEGLKFIVSSPLIMQIMFISFTGSLIFGISGIILIALVQLHYMLPSYYISMIFGVLIVGMASGSVVGRKVSGSVGKISVLTFIVIGFALISVYFINNIFIITIPSAIIGLATGILNVTLGTAILKIVPQDMMARIQGGFSTFSLAIVSFSGILGGLLAEGVGYTRSFLILGIAIIAVALLLLVMGDINRTII